MENSNYNRNQSYQRDWDENDYGYDRSRRNQNKSHGYGNFNRENENFRSGGWQSSGFRGDYNDPNRRFDDRDSYYDTQSGRNFNRNYQNRWEGNQGNNWNLGYENRPYNQNYGQDYGSDFRNRGERNWWDRTSDEVASWFGDEEAEQRRRMDKIYGPHKGKGPKGFTRSDERITEDINEKLYEDDYVDASNIEVNVSGGEVTLTGTVDSRNAKRHAEDLAESVSGVKNIQNNLRVSSNASYETSNSQTSEQYNGRRKTSVLS